MANSGYIPSIEHVALPSSSASSPTLSVSKVVAETTTRQVDDEVERVPSGTEVRDVLSGGDVAFKTMSWWHVGILMIAETISLGILSLPWALATLGFIPGFVLIVVLGIIAGYAGFVIGQFKLAHPDVFCMADAGAVLFESLAPRHHTAMWGRKLFGMGFVVFLVFVMSAHVLTFSIMMNALTGHGTCSIVFAVVGALVSFVCTLPRTLKSVSWLSIASFASILASVIVVMISVGLEHKGNHSHVDFEVIHKARFASGILAVMNIVLAYAGNVAFFGFISELKKPHDFPKSLVLLQCSAIILYIVVGTLVYHFIGPLVPAPALGAANPLFRKIAWGLAIPTIVVAGVINGSVALKYIFVVLKGELITSRSCKAKCWWASLNAMLWISAWLIAEAIPNFAQMLGLVSSLLGTWFTYGIPGGLWLHMNKKRWSTTWSKVALMVLNIGLVLLGLSLSVLGSWAALKEIVETPSGSVFSCKDNSIG